MKTISLCVCENCEEPIHDPSKGIIIHGNIYSADTDFIGGLIGDNFPKNEQKITKDDVKKIAICVHCLTDIFNSTTAFIERSVSNI